MSYGYMYAPFYTELKHGMYLGNMNVEMTNKKLRKVKGKFKETYNTLE